MRLVHLPAVALLLGLTAGHRVTAQPPSPGLRGVVQEALRGGASIGLVVELRDLRTPNAVPGRAVNDKTTLERLALTSSEWHVSSGTVPRVARRARPSEVDGILTTPVRVTEGTLTLGRALFIVPRMAVHGTLTGVAGGGIPSEACRLERHVQLDDRTRSLADFLDAVAAQAPGIAWVLTWDADSPLDTISLGVMCADGSMNLLGMFLSP